ncbi:chemotaxis protein CheA [Pelagicoccus albus]|uniref:Chemotaxis protein CheA n=1 Tax=Pelagicoccus albus TaxID=415222 RepID=A0A7X1B6D3_9BACT|nr:chemotaxis protein CheA [Pelagicoccus albus]MBC2606432.1 chemotaxis protein CheA [Pelagicoccus albus]
MRKIDPSETFLQEAEELLLVIEGSALDLANDDSDEEAINQLFRAFHTLKGSSAMFGFDKVSGFTHHVEFILEEARDGKLKLSDELINLILESKDQIKGLLEGEESEACKRIVDRLRAIQGSPEDTASPENLDNVPTAAKAELTTYRIVFKPSPDIALSGQDPAHLLEDLRGLGECNIQSDTDSIPPIEEITPDICYLAWTIELTTEVDENAIRDVFIFVEDESQISIEKLESKNVPTPQDESPEEKAETISAKKHSSHPQSTVRVPSEKLDRLVNLVGELVMNQSRLTQVASSIESSELGVPVEEIERLVSELRDSVLGIRMMPIGSTFNRFRRLVHDLSCELGKKIDLTTEGEETELDKTVLDQLGDPLVHLIRNSIDHGIESPAERVANGKEDTGNIRLAATHEGAHVVVTIEDDGHGIDEERVLEKARERGLINNDSNLSKTEIFDLIFQPGFSTAKDLTNVSGRGVGMDVVKRQLEGLGGSIKITSNQGKGTRIDLTLPLTLAIIDGLLVEVDGDRLIIPMSAVTENVEITPTERAADNGRNIVNVRGEQVPYIRLRNLFNRPENGPAIEKVVIANHERQRIGFVVDRVLGSHQTVIQSLGKLYDDIEVVSGSTIMGDGSVALIVDVAGIIRYDTKTFRPEQSRRPSPDQPHPDQLLHN